MLRLLSNALALLPLALGAPFLAAPAHGGPPPEGRCPTVGGVASGGPATDAAPIRLHEGMLLRKQDLLLLRRLLPDEVWQNRHAFFHQGMAMTLAACHRRYPVPHFYEQATALHAGQPHLDDQIVGVVAPMRNVSIVNLQGSELLADDALLMN